MKISIAKMCMSGDHREHELEAEKGRAAIWLVDRQMGREPHLCIRAAQFLPIDQGRRGSTAGRSRRMTRCPSNVAALGLAFTMDGALPDAYASGA